MENTGEESCTGSKQDEEEHRSKQDDQKARLEEYKRLIDLKADLRQSNLNLERPASVDSTTQTGHPGAGDLQEINVYEKMFINDLREIFKRIGVNTKHKSRDMLVRMAHEMVQWEDLQQKDLRKLCQLNDLHANNKTTNKEMVAMLKSLDTAMDITQILPAAQSPDANLRTVAEGNLKQFQEHNAQQQNPGNAQVRPNQNSPVPASMDSTTQTGHPGAGDLQEINVYEKMFINDLREIFKRIGVNTKHKSRDMLVRMAHEMVQWEDLKKKDLRKLCRLNDLHANNKTTNKEMVAMLKSLQLKSKQIIKELNIEDANIIEIGSISGRFEVEERQHSETIAELKNSIVELQKINLSLQETLEKAEAEKMDALRAVEEERKILEEKRLSEQVKMLQHEVLPEAKPETFY